MSNKIVVVTDHNVSKELDLICSIYPNSEVLLFSSGNEIVHSHVSCFDFTDLAGVDHVRQIVSLRDSRSHDFYMISYITELQIGGGGEFAQSSNNTQKQYLLVLQVKFKETP